MDNASIIHKYFPNLDKDQKKKFECLGSLYAEWNSRINVISRKDINHLYERHILHSLAIAKVIEFQEGAKILDIGTGGGFPGIPLAIMSPETQFCLVDSIGKKIRVVQNISSELGLTNVKTFTGRIEEVDGKYDFIVCRAVARVKKLYSWSLNKIEPISNYPIANGMLLLKGGYLEEELDEFNKEFPIHRTSIHHIRDYFSEDFFKSKMIIHIPIIRKT